MLESGVSGYETFYTEVKMQFPRDLKGHLYANCSLCWFYSASAMRCNLTKDACFNPTKYVNGTCPFLPAISGQNATEDITDDVPFE